MLTVVAPSASDLARFIEMADDGLDLSPGAWALRAPRCLFVCSFVCWFVCLSVGLFVYWFVGLLVCWVCWVSLFVCLFVCLFVVFVCARVVQ